MISVNIDKAKAITHDKRRAVRAGEFAPLDDVIAKQLPGIDPVKIEGERQAIRDKYTIIQAQVDAATTADDLLNIIKEIGG